MIYFMNRNNIISKEESNKYKSYIYLIGRSEQLCIRYRFLLFQRVFSSWAQPFTYF